MRRRSSYGLVARGLSELSRRSVHKLLLTPHFSVCSLDRPQTEHRSKGRCSPRWRCSFRPCRSYSRRRWRHRSRRTIGRGEGKYAKNVQNGIQVSVNYELFLTTIDEKVSHVLTDTNAASVCEPRAGGDGTKAGLGPADSPAFGEGRKSCKTAKEVWENLQRAFDDNGLTRRVGLLKDLVNTTLESSGNVGSYVNKIITTAHKLRNIGFEVNDAWLGNLMLTGLPDVYAPMIMGFESFGANISADLIKAKLLQEVKSADTSTALYVKSKPMKYQHQSQQSKVKRGPRNCNNHDHFAKFCTSAKGNKAEHEKGKKGTGFVAAFSRKSNEKWFMDSGASIHMTALPTNGQDKQVESQLCGSSPSTSTTHTGNILAPTEQVEEPLSETVEEALSSPYAKQWQQAMDEE
ncbi:hypothetical protein EVAR_80442_1 [Eumeta japonica]|uniref:Retrovirus-related Pol polyprotein from transposon TNT 1-94 n=1 Tax=Eumeta variegata TaxID=151549 RepID=A0A4C1VIP3_EUMVA|nr:hypothetical protein EVAR_80442_1 [Eumeta japonica]